MPWTHAKIKRELDRKRAPRGLQEAMRSHPLLAMETLFEVLEDTSSTKHQIVHALSLIQEIKLNRSLDADSQHILCLVKTHLYSREARVRHAAAKSLVRFLFRGIVYRDFRIPTKSAKQLLLEAQSSCPSLAEGPFSRLVRRIETEYPDDGASD